MAFRHATQNTEGDGTGQRHREGGVGVIQSLREVRTSSVTRFMNDAGLMHREDGPAIIEYRSDGGVQLEEYYLHDLRHRVGGPAYIEYRSDGNVEREYYYLHDLRHRVGGPAYLRYREDGSVLREVYYLRGMKDGVTSFKKETE